MAVFWHTGCMNWLARYEYSELQEAETIVAYVQGNVTNGVFPDAFRRCVMTQRSFMKRMVAGAVVVGLVGVVVDRANAWPWPWVNPEIYNSGSHISGVYFDPFTGRLVVRTDRTRVRESYLDPSRSFADFGSKHYVDYVQTDANGVQWRVRGWKWTSNGVPHGNVQRTRITATGIPGVDHEEGDRVLYSYHTGKNRSQMPGQDVGEPVRSHRHDRQTLRRGTRRQSLGDYNPF